MWIVVGLLFSSAWMAAVGWFVGLVHYPGFREVAPERWTRFHAMHTSRTGWIVGPALLLQGSCTALLFTQKVPAWLLVASVVCAGLSIGWTAFISGPLHGPLSREYDDAVVDRLISTNGVRAVAWSMQAALCAIYLGLHLSE